MSLPLGTCTVNLTAQMHGGVYLTCVPASTSRFCVREHPLCSTESHPCVLCAHDRIVEELLVSEGSGESRRVR